MFYKKLKLTVNINNLFFRKLNSRRSSHLDLLFLIRFCKTKAFCFISLKYLYTITLFRLQTTPTPPHVFRLHIFNTERVIKRRPISNRYVVIYVFRQIQVVDYSEGQARFGHDFLVFVHRAVSFENWKYCIFLLILR